jgi:dTDP-4-dehydrorhamnose 3,5-epimerase-like enzyme
MGFEKPSWVERNQIIDSAGNLHILELPFVAKRLYYIQGVPTGAQRGFHAHKSLQQIFLLPQGRLELELTTPNTSETFILDSNETRALLVPPGYWRTMSNFTPDAICLVLASDHYDESDYLRNFKEYSIWFSQVFSNEG